MAGITLAQAETQLALWLAADTKLAQGQDVSVGSKRVSRIDTQSKIEFWEKKVQKLSRGGIRISGATPT